MTLHSGERQVAEDLSGIREDHRYRYEWAAERLSPNSSVIDIGCGVGYGAFILAKAGHKVTAIDRDQQTIEFARQHYAHENIIFICDAASTLGGFVHGSFDAAVCFEMIEHLKDPLPMLRDVAQLARTALVSVPNEDKFPYLKYDFHFRHYTRAELNTLLRDAGMEAVEWLGQFAKTSKVVPNVEGRTIVAIAHPKALLDEYEPNAADARIAAAQKKVAPRHVAIVGLGPSCAEYLSIARGLGGRSAYCDEVWTINALGDVFACDRVFHMDDVRVQEIRAAAAPASNIAKMLRWLKTHPGPVMTSFTHPDYPGLIEFPLEDVINDLGFAYFNNTAAYAVGYAIHIGVKKISMIGCDYTYPNAHDAEKGRACTEYWLGFARARGIEIATVKTSSLLDACDPWDRRLYGYDMVRVGIVPRDNGTFGVEFTPRDAPTAEEIEDRYDHSKHPSPLMTAESAK